MSNQIYIDRLGYRNAIADKDQIIWFWEQTATQRTKSFATRFWLDLKEQYQKHLIKIEAFELLDFINSKVKPSQEVRRALSRIKTKEKNEKEMKEIMSYAEQNKLRRNLINEIRLN